MRLLVAEPKFLVKYHADLRIVLAAGLFYGTACLGYLLAFKNTVDLPLWPPSGLAFALIILMGRSIWPGIAIGSLLANLMAYWNNPSMLPHNIIALSSLTAAVHTIEALIGNFMITRWIKDDYPFHHALTAFKFLFVALLMCGISAVLGSFSLYINHGIGDVLFTKTAISWWIGNVVGILLFTPFILSCAYFVRFKFSTEKALEVAVFLLFAAGVFFLGQQKYFNQTLERGLPFMILPFLLWLAFRFELAIAMGGVLIVSLVSVYVTVNDLGPFVLQQAHDSMLLLQIFIFVMSVSTIVLSATVKERIEAQRKLLGFTETLEAKVLERTKELNEEINVRKAAEEKLQRTNEELSKRNTELDNFVYSVSHDLRAPIASVLGLINLAKKDVDISMKDVYLDMINNSAKLQDHFIREILDQSRNSRLEIRREEIFFQPIIEETFDQLRFATSTGKAVEKIINIKQEKPFYSDRWRLKVILNNIISNAIRYRNGKDPVIKVDVEIDNLGATLSIEDNGKGIAREHLANVCKMFYRATDDGAGSGLGLYIVKETLDKLHGSIDIDSEVGKGTMIRVSIPEVV
jgi:signal transduction histidine kinase